MHKGYTFLNNLIRTCYQSLLFKQYFYYYVLVYIMYKQRLCACECRHMYTMICIWKSQVSFQEMVLSCCGFSGWNSAFHDFAACTFPCWAILSSLIVFLTTVARNISLHLILILILIGCCLMVNKFEIFALIYLSTGVLFWTNLFKYIVDILNQSSF